MKPAPDEMTCQELVELVTAYLEDALPARDRGRFEAHLRDCPYCEIYLDQVRQTMRRLRDLREESIAPEAREALLAAFRGWKAGR
jgi:anti-sigma factor RsiW